MMKTMLGFGGSASAPGAMESVESMDALRSNAVRTIAILVVK